MLKLNNLSVLYKSTGLLAVKDVSFEVKEGEVISILGPSGCGKTTILNAISGLLTENEVEIKGLIKFSKRKLKIRTVFQESRLLPWRTVLENASLGLEAEEEKKSKAQERAREFIKLVGLSDFENYLPSRLSGGMKQRVNFARALVCKPDLLLLDEPFSSLDSALKDNIQKKFLKILESKNMTSIFVTHDEKEAHLLAHKIIVLSKGPSIVEDIQAG